VGRRWPHRVHTLEHHLPEERTRCARSLGLQRGKTRQSQPYINLRRSCSNCYFVSGWSSSLCCKQVKVKVKLSLSTVWWHIGGIRGISLLILNLGTRYYFLLTLLHFLCSSRTTSHWTLLVWSFSCLASGCWRSLRCYPRLFVRDEHVLTGTFLRFHTECTSPWE
jgi:hypothetical protein